MLKKIITVIVELYLLPLRLNARIALYAKGLFVSRDEHFLITCDVIKNYFPNSKGVIIDVGAYDGDSAIFFAKRFGNTIIGFEPNPTPFLKSATSVKHFPGIKMYNLGLSNVTGKLDLYITGNEVSSSFLAVKDFSEISFKTKITVPVTTLDNFFADYSEILLLKLDAQGAELNILESGIETLKKTSLVLTEVSITEMYHDTCLYHEVDKFLRDNNFKVHTLIANYNNEGTKYFDALYIKSQS